MNISSAAWWEEAEVSARGSEPYIPWERKKQPPESAVEPQIRRRVPKVDTNLPTGLAILESMTSLSESRAYLFSEPEASEADYDVNHHQRQLILFYSHVSS